MEEKELAEQCRRGDNRACRELYERYAGRMLALCLRYSGNREVAEDLLHDGFLKLFSSFDKFTWRGEGSLRAWMERVMVNTALQYLRQNDVLNKVRLWTIFLLRLTTNQNLKPVKPFPNKC